MRPDLADPILGWSVLEYTITPTQDSSGCVFARLQLPLLFVQDPFQAEEKKARFLNTSTSYQY